MRVHKVVSSRDKTLGAISMLVNGGAIIVVFINWFVSK